MINFLPAALVAALAGSIAWADWLSNHYRGRSIRLYKYADLLIGVAYALFFVGCLAYLI